MIVKYKLALGIGAWVLSNLMTTHGYADVLPKTCFGLESTTAYVSEDNLEAVVQLVTVDYESKEKIKGTGFIVRASSGQDLSGYNRILTARHFIDDSKEFEDKGGMTEVYSSNGTYLGTAVVVATSKNLQLPSNASIKAGEVSVMGMNSVISDKTYRAIMGLKLGGLPKNPLLSAISLTYPSGISFGASGAPVLSLEGYVQGMVTNNIQDVKNEKTTIKAGDITVMKKTGIYREVKATLPLKSVAVMENLWDKRIIEALGDDALAFTQEDNQLNVGILPVITQSACLILQGSYIDLKSWLEKFAFQ